jgi:hypothetical protein
LRAEHLDPKESRRYWQSTAKGRRSLGPTAAAGHSCAHRSSTVGWPPRPAPTIIKPHLMHTMHIEDDKVVIGHRLWHGARAVSVMLVAQLYLHTQVLQPFLLKPHPCSVLLMMLVVVFIRVPPDFAPRLHATEVLHELPQCMRDR